MTRRYDNVDLHANELGRNLGGAFWATFRPPILDCDSAAFQPSSCSRCKKAAIHGCQAAETVPKTPIIGSTPVCCARVASGHAAAAPPSEAKNFRRPM
jgi:hypothetical protein